MSNNPLYTTPRMRTLMSFANDAKKTFKKHGDASHGHINEMEEKINNFATADEMDVLTQHNIMSGTIHNSNNRYILLG